MFATALLHLLLATLAAFVAPVLGCPPPLNNFDFIGNETYTSAQLIKAALLPQDGIGWTAAVSNHLRNPIKPWPRDTGKNTYTIPYCFANQKAKDDLAFLVTNAIQLWMSSLNGPASKESGHGLQIKSYERLHEPRFCRKEDGSWNDVHPRYSVVIDEMTEQGEGRYTLSYASYGFQPKEFNSAPGRHRMRINWDLIRNAPNAVALIAHEWGHIMGMMHEHQRRDAVTYVHFGCKNLADYNNVQNYIEALGDPGDTIEDVCKDGAMAVKYGCMANDWTPNYVQLRPENGSTPGSLRLGLYHESKAGMMPGKDANSIGNTVLVRWTEPGPHPEGRKNDNCEVFGLNPRPSPGDRGFVQNIYPWKR